MSSQAETRMAGNNEKHCTVRPFHLPQARITKLPTIQDVIISLKLPIKVHTAGGRLTAIFPRQTVVFVLMPACDK